MVSINIFMKIKHVFPIAAITSCMVFVSCGQQQQSMPQAKYETMKVKAENRNLEKTFSATIRGRQDIEIYPEVSGKLTKLCVTEGQNVKKGQVLFVIDQVPYAAQVETAKANVRAAEASLATAELNYKSEKNLFDKKVVSEYDLKTSENALLTAKATLAQAEANLTAAKQNLGFCTVTSPSDGVVGTFPYRIGALVSPSVAEPLTTVSQINDIYAYFSLTEKDLLELTRAGGTLEEQVGKMPAVKLQLSDGSMYEESGKIDAVSGVIEQTTGSVSMRAIFPNAKNILRSGGSANVVFPYVIENILLVPQSATVDIQDKKFVYVLQADSTVKYTEIKISNLNDGKNYIVLDGLKSGDKIAVEGVTRLSDGMKITPISQAQKEAKFQQALKDQREGNLATAFN